jgi:hypothetical protein
MRRKRACFSLKVVSGYYSESRSEYVYGGSWIVAEMTRDDSR